MRPPSTADPLDRSRFPVDPWALRERRYEAEDLGTTETLFSVGNGYLGLRGNVEEGRDSYAHGTFVNGFHEVWPIHHAEEAFGFAKVGQTIVNAPDAKIMRLYVDDEPLLLSVADLEEYERSLDFRDGVLTRELLWRTPSGKRVRLRSRRMVSFAERHLAVMDYEITMVDADAPVAVSCQILNRQDGQDEYHVKDAAMGSGFDPRRAANLSGRVLQPSVAWEGDGRSVLGYRVTSSGMTLAVAADHTISTTDAYEVRSSVEDDLAKHVYRIQATRGTTTRITKVVSYHTSRGVPAVELVDRCRRVLDRVRETGIQAVLDEQRAWLDDFWTRSDVEIGGTQNAALQQAVRWNLFQLIQASARAEGNGVPAKGVTGSGYDGHYFWDTEIYVLPFLTYTSPNFARNALRFRYSMLDHARQRAKELNQRGALYPWRTINGEEASAYYAAGTAQYHIDADIAHALTQYVTATGDTSFLDREAIDVLVETARLWADLGFWREASDADPVFHIHGVTGPDEYTAVVNDNLFTNVMARANLRSAVRALRSLARRDAVAYERVLDRLALTEEEIAELARIADGMHVPFDDNLGIHPQDDDFLSKEIWDLANTPADKRPLLLNYHPLVIYRHQVLKQADVVLALFLQGDEFTLEEKLANFEYYDPLTTGDSTLSAVVQSIVAAEVGYGDLAAAYFTSAVYVDLADLHRNADAGVHVASLGGVWNALVSGFGGMRDYLGAWTFDPRLPAGWDSLTYRLTLGGNRLRVTVLGEEMLFELETGDADSLTVRVQGEEVVVARGGVTRVPVTRIEQREGRPSVRDIEGSVREDGSILTATVPSHPNGD